MEIRQSNIARTGPLPLSPSGPLATQAAAETAPVAAPVPKEPLVGDAVHGAALTSDLAVASSLTLDDVAGQNALESLLAGNAQAMADLQKLQEEGRLTPDVMAALAQLATQPLADGIDRADLISTALRQLADPSSVNQGDQFTCAPAVVQTMLAKDDPAEFLRLVSGLASPEGTVTLKNGATITRDPNWQLDSTRSVIDNLMQPAFMQYATGGTYDSATDTRLTANGSGQGLYAAEMDKLIAAVTGQNTTSILGSGPEVMEQLGLATADGQNVSAIIKYVDENGEVKGHAVLVESVKDGMVTYIDPKEGRKTVSIEEFQAKLQSVSLPDKYVTPKLAAAAMKEGEGLLAGGFLRRLRRAFRRVTSGIKKAVKGIGKAFKKIGNVLKKALYKVVDFIAPALPILSVAAWLIPGVGPVIGTALKIAQGVVAAVNAIRAAESGDILGALASGASAFAGVVTGPASGIAAKFASYAKTAKQVVSAVKSGDFGAALGAIAAVTGNQDLSTAANVASAVQNKDIGAALGAVGAATGNQTVSTIGNVASAVQNKDYGAALGAVGAATNNQALTDALNKAAGIANTAQQVKHAIDNKDYLGAAMTLNSMAVDAKLLDAKTAQDVQKWLERGQAMDQARKTGDVSTLVDLAAKTAGELGVVTPKEYEKVASKIKQGLDLYQAAKRGDTEAAIRLGAQVAKQTGLFDPKKIATAEAVAQQIPALRDAIKNKDYGTAAKTAARIGYDLGVLGITDTEAAAKVEAMANRVARLNEGLEAARRGDVLRTARKIAEAVDEERFMRELDELNNLKEAFEARQRELIGRRSG